MKVYVQSNTETFEYVRSSDIRPWSQKEEERTKEMSSYVTSKIFEGGYEEFYAENNVDTIETFIIDGQGVYKDEEVTVEKLNLVYTQLWDENDMRVKRGKAVVGSTYYAVYGDDGAIDETNFAYKTKADALHAAQLYIDEKEQWIQYYKRKEGKQ